MFGEVTKSASILNRFFSVILGIYGKHDVCYNRRTRKKFWCLKCDGSVEVGEVLEGHLGEGSGQWNRKMGPFLPLIWGHWESDLTCLSLNFNILKCSLGIKM